MNADKLVFRIRLTKSNYSSKKHSLDQSDEIYKLKNFQKQSNKINYLRYVITPKGISERTKLTLNFMQRKMEEYDELKQELNKDK